MEKNIDWLERCNEEKIKLAVVGNVVIIGTRNSCDDTNGCLLNKISRGLMVYGGVEYTYKYTHFLHKYTPHFTVKIMC